MKNDGDVHWRLPEGKAWIKYGQPRKYLNGFRDGMVLVNEDADIWRNDEE